MRVGSVLFLCVLVGCSKPAPVVAVDPLVGAWGDAENVFQFFDNGTCVLLGKRFNVSGSYSFSDSKLLITDAKLQYHAPGFIRLKASDFGLGGQLTTMLSVTDTSGSILPAGSKLSLSRLSTENAKSQVATISAVHREAVRNASKKR